MWRQASDWLLTNPLFYGWLCWRLMKINHLVQ